MHPTFIQIPDLNYTPLTCLDMSGYEIHMFVMQPHEDGGCIYHFSY